MTPLHSPVLRASRQAGRCLVALLAGSLLLTISRAATNVFLLEVPDYQWHSGCFGTASGNLMGYWDRNGFPDFYTGPTQGGVAPLDSRGINQGIFALWVSKAGRDGRSPAQPGHEDDYYVAFDSTRADPYTTAGRPEHAPDCIGDFIGLSQKKWKSMAGECDGNIDGYCFVYWDKTGARRDNFVPGPEAGLPTLDLASGLRNWSAWRGTDADVFTQLADFNPTVQAGSGFTYQDVIAEIEAGYPVLVLLQDYDVFYRSVDQMPRANPNLHGMLIYGYYLDDSGTPRVYIRNSWGDSSFDPLRIWRATTWAPSLGNGYPVRGVIGFHPKPRITSCRRVGDGVEIEWQGPSARLQDVESGETRSLHWYVVEACEAFEATDKGFRPVTEPATALSAVIRAEAAAAAFYRVRLVTPP